MTNAKADRVSQQAETRLPHMSEANEERGLIDVPQVLEDLQAVVAEKGDGYVDPGSKAGECDYETSDGQPSCIVGHVFARHGLLQLRPTDGLSISGSRAFGNRKIHRFFTEPAVDVLQAAQDLQDGGRTWGEALVAAKEAAAQVSA